MTRLDKIEENQAICINMLRTTLAKVGYDDEEDDDGEILPTPLSKKQDLHDMDKRLQDEQLYRCKMVFCHNS